MKLQKSFFIAFLALTFFTSCADKSQSDDKPKTAALIDGESLGGLIKSNESFLVPENLTAGGSGKGDLKVNEELPETFKDRQFMKNAVIAQRNISNVVGFIVRYDNLKKDYFKCTLRPVILGDSLLQVQEPIDKVNYYSYIGAGGKLSGGFASVGTLNVETDNVVEVRLEDIAQCEVPSNRKDDALLQSYINSISQEKLSDYYFVEGAVLTNFTHKKFSKTKFDAKVNMSWVSIDGSAYGTNDKLSTERLVSLQLISLKDLLKP